MCKLALDCDYCIPTLIAKSGKIEYFCHYPYPTKKTPICERYYNQNYRGCTLTPRKCIDDYIPQLEYDLMIYLPKRTYFYNKQFITDHFKVLL